MGQHKHNKTAIMAKNGLLPPKEERKKPRYNVEYYLLQRGTMTNNLREVLSVAQYIKNKGY